MKDKFNPLDVVTEIADPVEELIDNFEFNSLVLEKQENSKLLNSLKVVRDDTLKKKQILEDKIIEILDKHGLNLINTVDVNVRISYVPSVEITDEKLVSNHYKVNKISIDRNKILADFRAGALEDERGLQIIEDPVVYIQRRKGKSRMNDVRKQMERLGKKYS